MLTVCELVHVLLFGYKCSVYEFIIKFPQFVFLTNFSYKSKFGLPVYILRAEFPPTLFWTGGFGCRAIDIQPVVNCKKDLFKNHLAKGLKNLH